MQKTVDLAFNSIVDDITFMPVNLCFLARIKLKRHECFLPTIGYFFNMPLQGGVMTGKNRIHHIILINLFGCLSLLGTSLLIVLDP
ncbi:MAG: hypothetical protein A2Y07_06995 [Planctomycetes bacterium GWF2_50_10]|nr:MAG: hypothetical protein A2Y07_06995 [Planctomycetes bacterium GWF2_50_10]